MHDERIARRNNGERMAIEALGGERLETIEALQALAVVVGVDDERIASAFNASVGITRNKKRPGD